MDRARLNEVVANQIVSFKEKPSGVLRAALKDALPRHLGAKEISVVTGVRRCGKSTFLSQIASVSSKTHHVYFLDLEDPLLFGFTLEDFQTCYELWQELSPSSATDEKLFLFDEIQNVNGWERWVRFLAEKPGHKVVVTGSNSEMLSSELASSLTGRHIDIHLTPFALHELLEHHLHFSLLTRAEQESSATRIAINTIVSRLLACGAFPRSYLEQDPSILPIYFNDIVIRDILRRRKVKHSAALLQLGSILAAEHTRLLNRRKVSEVTGIKDNLTLSKYCNYFKECFLFSELRAYSPSRRKQLRSLSKFYSVDAKLPATIAPIARPVHSASFENLVYLELARNCSKIAYWHSKNRYEVDFILEFGEHVAAVQAAYSVGMEETLSRECRALEAANAELGCGRLYIVTLAEERTIEAAGCTIRVIPLDKVHQIFA